LGKRVLICGGEGYIGFPLTKHLLHRGDKIWSVDNLLRERLVKQSGANSIFPILSIEKRKAILNSCGYDFTFTKGDITDYGTIFSIISQFNPEVIVHLAEIPAAPFSMENIKSATLTQYNNVIGTLNLLFSIRDINKNIHLIKIATAGEWGTPKIPITEGFIEIEYKGKRDILPFPKQPGSFYHACFDEETEILTEDGWKFFKELNGEKVGTINSKQELEYQVPLRKVEYDYDGKLFYQIGQRINLKTTPNHRMFVSCNTSKQKLKNPRFVLAKDIKGKRRHFLISAPYLGQEEEFFVLPECSSYKGGPNKTERTTKQRFIKMDDWLFFLGWWLAEGTVFLGSEKHKEYRVMLATKYRKEEAMQAFVKIGLEPKTLYNKSNGMYQICVHDKQLSNYLKQLGKQHDRFIPKEFKFVSKRQLDILLSTLISGDGYKNHKGWVYVTISPKLANDVQEISLKLGFSAIIGTRPPSKKGKFNSLRVYISKSSTTYTNAGKDNSSYVDYKGKVYCCEVPNGTIVIKRNGRPSISGNSKVHDSTNIELASRIWDIKCTNVYQGVLFGTRINTLNVPGLETRFDVDPTWGTVINRMCAQAVIEHPLTVYGKGGQTRGFLPLRDSIQCLTILIDNSPKGYRIVNQLAETYKILDLACTIQKIAGEEFNLIAPIIHYKNPRHEQEEHFYSVERKILSELGYKPSITLENEIRLVIQDLLPHKERIKKLKHLLIPSTQWSGKKERSKEISI